jgi:hypothetical protein
MFVKSAVHWVRTKRSTIFPDGVLIPIVLEISQDLRLLYCFQTKFKKLMDFRLNLQPMPMPNCFEGHFLCLLLHFPFV